MPASPTYIVVEGPIGVGKTTLVEGLGRVFGARTLLERFEENPFLAPFYGDRGRYALATETFFLMSRFHQQEQLVQEDLLVPRTVSDYLFAKCRLFAEMTLSADEFRLFDSIYAVLSRDVPAPDLVIHLHAPVPVLVDRVARRARSYELGIEPNYLDDLDRRYRALFHGADPGRLLSIDTTHVDFRSPQVVAALAGAIEGGVRGELDPKALRDGIACLAPAGRHDRISGNLIADDRIARDRGVS